VGRTFDVWESAYKNGITDEQIDHVLANVPIFREDDGEDSNGNPREVVVGYDATKTYPIELVIIYDDSKWDFIVIHANRAQEPWKGKFLESK
jgi:uncharacterized DUF497 family protein